MERGLLLGRRKSVTHGKNKGKDQGRAPIEEKKLGYLAGKRDPRGERRQKTAFQRNGSKKKRPTKGSRKGSHEQCGCRGRHLCGDLGIEPVTKSLYLKSRRVWGGYTANKGGRSAKKRPCLMMVLDRRRKRNFHYGHDEGLEQASNYLKGIFAALKGEGENSGGGETWGKRAIWLK